MSQQVYSKWLFWAVLLRFAVIAFFFDSLLPLFPYLAESFNLSDDSFQKMLGVALLTFAMCQLISVYVINRIGCRLSILLSCICIVLAVVVIYWAQSPWLMIIAFLSLFAVNGIGSSATRITLRDMTTDSSFKRIFSWATTVVEIKQIILPVIVGIITAFYGWKLAMIIVVLPVGIVGMLFAFAREEQVGRVKSPGLSEAMGLLKYRPFLLPVLVASFFQITFGPVNSQLPFILQNEIGASAEIIGLFISITSAIIALSFLISGYLTTRITNRHLIAIGVVILSIALLTLMTRGIFGAYAAIGGVFLVKFSAGFFITPCTGAALNVPTKIRPLASSLFGFIQPLSYGLAVFVSGAVGLVGSWGLAILIAISVTAMAILAMNQKVGGKLCNKLTPVKQSHTNVRSDER